MARAGTRKAGGAAPIWSGGARRAQVSDLEAALCAHYGAMFALAFRILGCRAAAEDAAQDACLSAACAWATAPPEDRIRPWLLRISANAALDRHRRAGRDRAGLDGWAAWEADRAAQAAARAGDRDWIVAAMARLDVRSRAVLSLVVLEGMTQAEAGAVLGMAEGTVAWHMASIKRKLAEHALAEEAV